MSSVVCDLDELRHAVSSAHTQCNQLYPKATQGSSGSNHFISRSSICHDNTGLSSSAVPEERCSGNIQGIAGSGASLSVPLCSEHLYQ